MPGHRDDQRTALEPVTIAATGGLGNQLFQLAAAMAIADATGRGIRICCRMYDRPLVRRAFVAARAAVRAAFADRDGRFRLRAMERRPLVLDVQRLATETCPADDVRLGFSRRSLKRAFRDESRVIPGTDILRTADEALDVAQGRRPLPPGTTPLIAGFMQDDRLVAPTIASLQRHLELPRHSAYLDRWLPTVTNRTVGVHVRRGDYLKPAFRDTLPVIPAPWFARAAHLVQERHGDLAFLVVTDEPAWAREHLRLPGPTTVASLDHPASPLEDLALLRACAHHVISNSTFGWWGARLSTADGMVVAPARWAIGRPTDPHLMPVAWHKLDNPEDGR